MNITIGIGEGNVAGLRFNPTKDNLIIVSRTTSFFKKCYICPKYLSCSKKSPPLFSCLVFL